jgi:two-component system, LytTR family, response regulator LytT
MKNLRILLVDDEYLALNLLEQYVQQLPDMEVIGKVKSPIQALEILQNEPVDILFLDIQMPVLSGTNLLKTLQRPPATIFTTAYGQHAVEAFDLNAVDYLLKPFSFERFLQSINKAKAFLQKKASPLMPLASSRLGVTVSEPISPDLKEFLTMKVDGKIEKVTIKDIIYIEGLREYIKIVTQSRNYVTLESMKNMEETLAPYDFVRAHKSYIVAKKRVQSLEGNLLGLGAKLKIPISRERKEEVVKAIFGI